MKLKHLTILFLILATCSFSHAQEISGNKKKGKIGNGSINDCGNAIIGNTLSVTNNRSIEFQYILQAIQEIGRQIK